MYDHHIPVVNIFITLTLTLTLTLTGSVHGLNCPHLTPANWEFSQILGVLLKWRGIWYVYSLACK